jgi:hypothetical protein
VDQVAFIVIMASDCEQGSYVYTCVLSTRSVANSNTIFFTMFYSSQMRLL